MGDSDMEILAKWMIKHGYATGHGDFIEDLLEELEWQIEERSQRAVEVEREACAKVCADIGKEYNNDTNKKLGMGYEMQEVAFDCADAIRARGQE